MRFKLKPKSTDWELYGTGPNCGVTKSLLETFMTCPQKLLFAYRQRMSPIRDTEALEFGNIFHEALDGFYGVCGQEVESGHSLKKIGSWGVDWLESHLKRCEQRDFKRLESQPMFDSKMLEQTEKLYGLAWVTLKAYIQHWEKDASEKSWEGLEEMFAYPFDPKAEGIIDRPTILLRGKRDGRYRDKRGKMWLFETKTKGTIEEETIIDRMPFEIQVMMYDFVTAREFGESLTGVTYNIVRRSNLRQGAKESLALFLQRVEADIEDRPEHYFVRYEVSIDSEERQRWLADFKGLMWRLIYWWEGQGHYRDSGACTANFGRCPFLPYCAGRPETAKLTKREHVFPELQAPI